MHLCVASDEDLIDFNVSVDHSIVFSPHPLGGLLSVEKDGEVVGIVSHTFNFSTFTGKPGLFIEAMIVEDKVEVEVMNALLVYAKTHQFGRVEWKIKNVKVNEARFFTAAGAKPKSDWSIFELTNGELDAVFAELQDDFEVRHAVKKDTATIITYLKKLASHLDMAFETNEITLATSLFGERPYAHVLLAEDKGQPIGFALYYEMYFPLEKKCVLFFEDLYVDKSARGKGTSKQLFAKLAQIAKEKECDFIEWFVPKDNLGAIAIYKKMGARCLEGSTIYRCDVN